MIIKIGKERGDVVGFTMHLLDYKNNMKKVLIVSEYFAPTQAIASNRWSKIAYYLKKNHDVSIDVLTIRRNYTHKESFMGYSLKDTTLKKETASVDNYIVIDYNCFVVFIALIVDFIKTRILKTNNSYKYNEGGVKYVNKNNINFISNLRDNLEVFLLNYTRYLDGVKCIKKSVHKYDYVITTYGPYWPNMVGHYIKKRNKNIIWMADFRDYCYRESDTIIQKLFNKIYLKSVCKTSDIVSEVLEGMDVEKFSKTKCVVVSNGYDPTDKKECIQPNKFTFLYTGTYYKEDDVTPLFEAIKELIDTHSLAVDDLEFMCAGNGADEYREVAKEFDLDQYVTALGHISREEAMRLQRQSAMLIQLGWNTPNEHMLWTGKTYEYMLAQKPIIYILNGCVKGSLISSNINKLGGVCYEAANKDKDIVKLKSYIIEKYNEWKKTGVISIDREEEYISQFSYPYISELVWKNLNK